MANLVEELKKEIQNLETSASKKNVGVIAEIGDGVIRAEGLSGAA